MTELEKYQKVNASKTLEELAKVIKSFADNNNIIEGRTESFDAHDMSENCIKYSQIRHNTLTRKYGIRQQAMYILFYNK